MANTQDIQASLAGVGSDSAPAARPDERTPLLGQDAGQSSSAGAGAAAGGTFSENIRKWRRQRWASTLFAFVLVATIVTLTLVFGGQHSSRSEVESSCQPHDAGFSTTGSNALGS